MNPKKIRYCPYCGGVINSQKTPIRCAQSSCDFAFWNNPEPIVAAIVEIDESVVLVRDRRWPPKMFGLVTGHLDPGEDPHTAILREVQEELGLESQTQQLVGVYGFPDHNQIIIAFHITTNGIISCGEEIDQYKVIPIEKLKPWRIGTGLAVRDWLASRRTPLPGQKVRGSESGRPLMAAFDLLGRRWLLRILWELRDGPAGFRELQTRCGNLSPDTINRRLKDAQHSRLVEQTAEGRWQLTELGRALKQPLLALRDWSEQWRHDL